MTLQFLRPPVVFATMALAAAAVTAQPAPTAAPIASAPAPGPAPDRHGPGVPRPPGPRPESSAPIDTTVSGKIARWLPNPNGDVDGLLLDDGTQVSFPPALSAQLLSAVKLQDRVQVLGHHGANARVVRATEIKTASTGRTIAADTPEAGPPPAVPPRPAGRDALTAMTASGRIATLLYTDRGDADGVLMDDGAAVRFPPHVGAQLATELKVGGTLYARGYGTRGAQGSAFEATRIGTSESTAHEVFGPRPSADGMAPPPPVPGPRSPQGIGPAPSAGNVPPHPLAARS